MSSHPANGISIEKVKKLTLAVQKVTDLLAQSEPIGEDLRRESVTFFSHLNLSGKGIFQASDKTLKESLAKICACLQLLKHAPVLKGVRMDLLEQAYASLSHDLSPVSPSVRPTSRMPQVIPDPKAQKGEVPFEVRLPENKVPSKSVEAPRKANPTVLPARLSERQELIVRFAKNHPQFALKELLVHFPSLSEKTVRNDLVVLCDRGLIGRFGVAPRSYYKFIGAVGGNFRAETSASGTELPYSYAETVTANAERSL